MQPHHRKSGQHDFESVSAKDENVVVTRGLLIADGE